MQHLRQLKIYFLLHPAVCHNNPEKKVNEKHYLDYTTAYISAFFKFSYTLHSLNRSYIYIYLSKHMSNIMEYIYMYTKK